MKRVFLAGRFATLSSLLGFLLVLSGCAATYSKSDFSCAAPTGVSCMSISGLDANIDAGNLPKAQKLKPRDDNKIQNITTERSRTANAAYANHSVSTDTPNPLRIPPKTLRVWIAPYQDEQGNLLDARRIYVAIHDGRWDIAAKKQTIRNQYRTINLIQSSEQNSSPTNAGSQNNTGSGSGLIVKDLPQ